MAQSDQGSGTGQNREKYPIVDFDASEPTSAEEREKKKEKDKRYEKRPFIIKTPQPDYTSSTLYHNEELPVSEFPFEGSRLVVSGVVLNSKALMSSNKSTVYSEYTIQIEEVIKQPPGQELQAGQQISADRLGGRVRYPNGAIILYLNDWQDLPEDNERYLFFLDNEGGKNPNYKIVTAYKLKEEGVTALDFGEKFQKQNGRKKNEFMKAAKDAAKGAQRQ